MVKVLHYEAFSRVPGMGNPAGIVMNADGMPDSEMLRIAAKVGFNETTFIQASEKADVRLRYFTPGHEMNLCGHATVASLYHLKRNGWFQGKDRITVETKAGVLPMEFLRDSDGDWSIRMTQEQPQFEPFGGDHERLARSIGLNRNDFHPELPVVYGSTGIWTLLIPMAGLESFSRMKPVNELFPQILTERPRASLHPFTLKTVDKDACMHARHFSSPFSGTVEDPVTGTASGVMGAYALTYIEPERKSISLTVEQGLECGRDGRVGVEVRRTGPYADAMEVRITGRALFVKEMLV